MHAKNFNVYLSSLGDLLNKKRMYNIPSYQRQYSWPIDKVDTLWDNLIRRQIDHDDSDEYLLGSIVTITKQDVDDVIDGQQRLISLTLMYCAIRDSLTYEYANINNSEFKKHLHDLIRDINKCIGGQSKPYIKLRDNSDAQLFGNICSGDYKKNGGRSSRANKAFHRNYIEFQKRFTALCNDDLDLKNHSVEGIKKLSEIINTVMDDVFVIDVRIAKEGDAQQIFEALNSTGEPLTQTDLIKNYILQICPNLEQSWDSAFNQFEDELKRNPKKSDDWVYYSMLSRNYQSGDECKERKDVAKKKLHKAVRNRVKNEKDAKDFVEDLRSDLDIIYKLERPRENNNGVNHMLYGLRQVGAVYFRRPLIAAVRRWGSLTDPRTVQLTECLLKFFFMYRTVCRMDIDKLRALARDLTIKIESTEKDIKVLHLCEMVLKLVYSKNRKDDVDAFHKRFLDEFIVQDYDADAIKYIFMSIERELQKKGGVHTKIDGLDVEHVFPQRASASEWPNHAELEELKNNIGNQTLLPEKWNKALRNYSFRVKKIGRMDDGTPVTLRGKEGRDMDGNPIVVSYEKSGFMINDYIRKCTEWTRGKVEERQKILLEYAEKIWNLKEYQ